MLPASWLRRLSGRNNNAAVAATSSRGLLPYPLRILARILRLLLFPLEPNGVQPERDSGWGAREFRSLCSLLTCPAPLAIYPPSPVFRWVASPRPRRSDRAGGANGWRELLLRATVSALGSPAHTTNGRGLHAESVHT